MSLRRTAIGVLVLAAIASILSLGLRSPTSPRSTFMRVGLPVTPYRPVTADGVKGPWETAFYCPGVPGIPADPNADDSALGGGITIWNPTDDQLSASVTTLGKSAAVSVKTVTVGARQRVSVDIGAIARQAKVVYAAVVVEISGAGATVEQTASSRNGSSITPCSNETSATWVLAEGSTLKGVEEYVIVSNPYPTQAQVDISFSVSDRVVTKPAFEPFVVPPMTTRVIPMRTVQLYEPLLSVYVRSRRGRVVVGRAMEMNGSGRSGSSITLGAPSDSESWWFAAGETGDGLSERFVVFNPNDVTISAELTPYDLQSGAGDVMTFPIPARRSQVIDLAKPIDANDEPLTPSVHAVKISVSSLTKVGGIVAERVITRKLQSGSFTTIVTGSQYSSSTWWFPQGVSSPTERALVVANFSNNPATFTVFAHGPGGAQPVPGLVDLAVPVSGRLYVDLTDPSAVGVPIQIVSNEVLVVEQWPGRGGDLPGRTAALGIPE